MNQAILLCLSFTMFVAVVLFMYVQQRIKYLGKSIDSMLEVLQSYSRDLSSRRQNDEDLYKRSQESRLYEEPESESQPKHIVLKANQMSVGETMKNDTREVVSDDDESFIEDSSDDESEGSNESLPEEKCNDSVEEVEIDSNTIKSELFENHVMNMLNNNSEFNMMKDYESQVNEKDTKMIKVNDPHENIHYSTSELSKMSVVQLKTILKEHNPSDTRNINKKKKSELVKELSALYKQDKPESSADDGKEHTANVLEVFVNKTSEPSDFSTHDSEETN